MKPPCLVALALALSSFGVAPRAAQPPARHVTTPREHLGFNLGDDYCLANYKQLESYWKKLATQSDRIKVVKIGVTEEGRDQMMAIVTSPENQKSLAHYQEISQRLGHAEGLTETAAHAMTAKRFVLSARCDRCGLPRRLIYSTSNASSTFPARPASEP